MVAKSTDLEECILEVMEEMAKKFGILQAILTVLNRNSSKIYIEVAYGLTKEERREGNIRSGKVLSERW